MGMVTGVGLFMRAMLASRAGIGRNAPVPRRVELPSEGHVVAISQVGGLHRRYTRAA